MANLLEDILLNRRFNGKNSVESARDLYVERTKYNYFAYDKLNDEFSAHGLQRADDVIPKPVIDFQSVLRAYYGKIDHKGYPIVIRNKVDKTGSRVAARYMKDLRNVIKFFTASSTLAVLTNSSDSKPIQAVNFVAYAFQDFIEDYQNACNCEQTKSNNEYLSNVKPYKGYESLYVLHKTYKKQIYDGFVNYINGTLRFNEVQNFDEFVPIFMAYLRLLGVGFPITRTAFAKSQHTSLFTSGLSIAIADLNYGHDQAKIDNFIDDPSFELYMKKAVKYGFMIDKHVPWRLVANLSSEKMQEYMRLFGIGNLEIFFDTNYNHAYKDDFKLLKKYMIDAYNSFVRANPYYSGKPIYCRGYLKQNRLKRKVVSQEEVNINYNVSYWLKIYAEIRNMEEGNRLDAASLDSLMQEVDILLTVKDSGYIERHIDEKIGQIDPYSIAQVQQHNRSTANERLAEDGLPTFKKISIKKLKSDLKSRTIPGALLGASENNRKRRASITAQKYGASVAPPRLAGDGTMSLKMLAQGIYGRADNLGGAFAEGDTYYNGPGDLGLASGKASIEGIERRQGSILYGQQRAHMLNLESKRNYTSNVETDDEEETTTDSSTSGLIKSATNTRSTRSGGDSGGGMGGGGY